MTAPDLTRVETLWVYLAADPLLWLTVTLAAYVVADRISARFGRHPLANPVLIAVALLAAILTATRTPSTAAAASNTVAASRVKWMRAAKSISQRRGLGLRLRREFRP